MSSISAHESAEGQANRTGRPTDADRVLLLALKAWGQRWWRHGDRTPEDSVGEFIKSTRARLAPAALEALRDLVEHGSPAAGTIDPSSALLELMQLHQATARVDLARVHPSWWVRAVREESPAVQRLVAASLPQSLRFALQAGLLLDSEDLKGERPAARDVASWVMSLSSERLVGGEAQRADDPPAVIMLTRLSARTGYRLCRLAGVCKLLLSDRDRATVARTTMPSRSDWLEERLSAADLDLRTRAQNDAQSSQVSRLRPRQRAARIGLTTVARLLAGAEPFRLRWALQHWPYPTAKLIRSLIPAGTAGAAGVYRGETLILKTAWDRLEVEGTISLPWPESPTDEPRSHLT